ncbi:prohibitin family protein [Candidatus Woesearchaeota archaeon]|nr:prohibitin family protein [Candidatus Woesearchaeota archaeon]
MKLQYLKTRESQRGSEEMKAGCLIVAAAAGALALVVGGAKSYTTIDTGYVGVVNRMGHVTGAVFDSGFQLKNPFDSVVQMSVRTREKKEDDLTVPTSEGLTAELDVSILYHLEKDKATEVYKKLGDDDQYVSTFVEPQIRSTIREVISGFKAEDLYTAEKRELVGKTIHDKLFKLFEERGLTLESVLIRDLDLPAPLVERITAKLGAEQDALAMQYVIQKEQQEAERKKIEAEGSAKAQEIMMKTLTPQLLSLKQIEALRDLGSKGHVVIMPYDQKLVPILSVDPTPSAEKP